MPSESAVRSARWLAYTLLAALVCDATLSGGHWWLQHQVRSGGLDDDYGATLDTLTTVFSVLQSALLLADVGVLLSLIGLARARGQTAPALRLAGWLFGLMIGLTGLAHLVGFFAVGLSASVYRRLYASVSVAHILATAAILWGLHQSRRDLASPDEGTPIAVATSGQFALAIMAALVWLPSDLAPSLAEAIAPLGLALNLLGNGALVWLVRVHTRTLAAGAGPASTPQPRAPTEAAEALTTFTNVLITRVLLVVAGVVFGVMANYSRSRPMAEFIGYTVPFLSIALGLIMLGALLGLARRLVAGADAVYLAAALMTFGLVIEGYGLKLVGDLFSGRLGRALGAMKIAPWVQGIGQTLSLGSMLALISAFSAIALMAGNARLRREAGTVRVLVVITAALALGVRGVAATRHPSLPVLLLLAVLALVMAIAALARFVSMARAAAIALSAQEGADAPGFE